MCRSLAQMPVLDPPRASSRGKARRGHAGHALTASGNPAGPRKSGRAGGRHPIRKREAMRQCGWSFQKNGRRNCASGKLLVDGLRHAPVRRAGMYALPPCGAASPRMSLASYPRTSAASRRSPRWNPRWGTFKRSGRRRAARRKKMRYLEGPWQYPGTWGDGICLSACARTRSAAPAP